MRTLAIDLGSKRVGLALSDAGGTLASPLDVLEVGSAQRAIEPVLHRIQREGVERIVIGLPLNMDGSAGAAALATLAWGRELGRRCGAPVIFVDERLSSFVAAQTLAQRRASGERLTHGKKKQRLDAVAAAAFLQEFLDGRLSAVSSDNY
jgi:putative Holliday junction resolvase